uniref:Uncharacterized protein n=1 Tax=Oryza rufipogon TaxID=4529 RepID=A0A0E0NTY9_ORYRU
MAGAKELGGAGGGGARCRRRQVTLGRGKRGDMVARRHGRRDHVAAVDSAGSVGADVDVASSKHWPTSTPPPPSPACSPTSSSPSLLLQVLLAWRCEMDGAR